MDFEDAELDGDERYLVYGGDLYDDYLDVSPPPSPPPPRRKPVKIDFEMDEADYKKMHDHIRQIQSNFLDESDALRKASKKSDDAAIRYVSGLMEKVSVAPVSNCNAPRRSGGHQITEVSMPGSDHSCYREEQTAKSSSQKSQTPSQISEETQVLLKSIPKAKTTKVPGHISAETVALLQANNPRSPFARSQSLKGARKDSRPRGEPARTERRKQIEQKLEGILDYEIPTTDRFSQMRRTLLDVNDKMVEHRILLDKYSGLDLSEPNNVDDEVERRYNQLLERNPTREGRLKTSEDKLRSSSLGVTGYGKGLVPNDTQPVTELRGRIRRLLCRSKNNPHYYRF